MYHSAPAAPTSLRPAGPPRLPAPPTTSPSPASIPTATSAPQLSSSTQNAYLLPHVELLRIVRAEDAGVARAEDGRLHGGEALDRTSSPTQHIPKPRSKNNYCSVCKSSYEDYLDVRPTLSSTYTPNNTHDASGILLSNAISTNWLADFTGSIDVEEHHQFIIAHLRMLPS